MQFVVPPGVTIVSTEAAPLRLNRRAWIRETRMNNILGRSYCGLAEFDGDTNYRPIGLGFMGQYIPI